MPSSSVQSYHTAEQAEGAYHAVNVELLPSYRGPFTMHAVRAELPNLWVTRAHDSAARLRHVVQAPARAFVTFLTNPGAVIRDGTAMSATEITRHSKGHGYHERSSGPAHLGSMSMRVEDMTAAGIALIGFDLAPPRNTQVVVPPPHAMARLQQLHAEVGALSKTAPHMIAQPEVARGLENMLVAALVRCLQTDVREERWMQRSHKIIMNRFRRVVEENPDRSLYIPEICAAINVSARSLTVCCQEHLGTSPKQYLALRRMHLANRALRAAVPSETTVTEIATRFGFWHFGRFAGSYRSMFGELPQATLRRASIISLMLLFSS